MSEGLPLILQAHEMAKLYSEKAGEWLLLEVLEKDEHDRAKKLALWTHSRQKEDIYEYLLETEDWNWSKYYVIIHSDPQKKCELL